VHTLFACEKFLLELISTYFHRHAYKERIKVSKYANGILEKLKTAIASPRPRKSINAGGETGAGQVNSVVSGEGPPSIYSDTTEKKEKKFKISKAGKLINRTVNQVAKEFNNVFLDPKSLQSASCIPMTINTSNRFSRDLFNALVFPGNDELFLGDFEPYFKTYREAKLAFRFFDVNQSGGISKPELKNRMSEIMQEKIDIEHSIEDVASAVSSLDWALLVAVIFLGSLLVLNIFQVPFEKYVSTLATVLLPLTFMFGQTARDIFECTIFLFFVHVYDVRFSRNLMFYGTACCIN
jgi:hypothetical protein